MDTKSPDFYFDLDDTLTGTNPYLYRRAKTFTKLNGEHDVHDVLVQSERNGLTTLQLPKPIGDYIFNHFLEDGNFMLSVNRSPLLEGNLDAFICLLKTIRAKGGKVAVCTHRGFHPKAKSYSEYWLDVNIGMKHFDEVHVLDPKVHPDKLKYLETQSESFKLVDDNPLHDLNKVHVRDSRILHYNGISDYSGYRFQRKVKSVSDIMQLL